MSGDESTASQATSGSTPPVEDQRPKVSDGKALRHIWRPTDGNGDPDITIFENSRYTAQGHPTWKLYCGDAPASINGTFVEPPKHVYLDDRSCYRILHFAGYNGAERGRLWRHDFDNKGGVKPNRKHRGRPALVEGGEIAEVRLGASKFYRFAGAEDLKEVALIAEELEAQSKGEVLTVAPSAPGKKATTTINKPPKRKLGDELIAGVDLTNGKSPLDENDIRIYKNGGGFNGSNKKARGLNDQTFAAIGSNSVSELRATIVSMQDRARIVGDALLELQRKNQELETSLRSQQILFHRSAADLAEARSQNNRLSAQLLADLPSATPSLQKDMEIVSLRNQAAIYRTIAVQLWGKHSSSTMLLEKSANASASIEALTETLIEMRGELKPLRREQMRSKEGWESVEKAMKAMLGEQYEDFEREAKTRHVDDRV